jgi:hypothetical protein
MPSGHPEVLLYAWQLIFEQGFATVIPCPGPRKPQRPNRGVKGLVGEPCVAGAVIAAYHDSRNTAAALVRPHICGAVRIADNDLVTLYLRGTTRQPGSRRTINDRRGRCLEYGRAWKCCIST